MEPGGWVKLEKGSPARTRVQGTDIFFIVAAIFTANTKTKREIHHNCEPENLGFCAIHKGASKAFYFGEQS